MKSEATTTTKVIFTSIRSPIGKLVLVGDYDHVQNALIGIRGIYFSDRPHADGVISEDSVEKRAPFEAAIDQLEAYFSGTRTSFNLPLAPHGTPFQRDVWRALEAIPYGTTKTYADIARSIGRPKAVRAVGAANGQNPLSIVVPCHRVIGKDGTLTGYAGGLDKKKHLLDLETRTHHA